MPTRRFETVWLGRCAIVFAAWLFIENAHARPGYVPPPTPLPPPDHADNSKHRSRICGYAANE